MKRKSRQKFVVSLVFALSVFYCLTDTVAQTSSGTALPQFLFPDFSKSTVLLKNGSTWSANFNYQTVDEEMVFMEKGKYLVPEKPDEIDTIYIKDRPFVPVERAFYEVVLSGKVSLYIQHKSKYSSVGTPTAYGMTSQTNAPTTGSIARTGNQVRTLEMPTNVQVTPGNIFWVKTNGEMNKVNTERQFLKIFPESETQLKEFIKKNKIDLHITKDFVKLGKYCNEIVK